jgi:hypothetical protein
MHAPSHKHQGLALHRAQPRAVARQSGAIEPKAFGRFCYAKFLLYTEPAAEIFGNTGMNQI